MGPVPVVSECRHAGASGVPDADVFAVHPDTESRSHRHQSPFLPVTPGLFDVHFSSGAFMANRFWGRDGGFKLRDTRSLVGVEGTRPYFLRLGRELSEQRASGIVVEFGTAMCGIFGFGGLEDIWNAWQSGRMAYRRQPQRAFGASPLWMGVKSVHDDSIMLTQWDKSVDSEVRRFRLSERKYRPLSEIRAFHRSVSKGRRAPQTSQR